VTGRGGQTWSTDMSTLIGIGFFGLPSKPENPYYSVRPDGAYYQWRKIPPRELSIDLVADERLVWATERAEAS